MNLQKIKVTTLILSFLVTSSTILPTIASATELNSSETGNNPIIEETSQSEDSTSSISTEQLKQKSISVNQQIEKTILAQGFSSVEEYNNQIGSTIPVEESVYYNNTDYYSIPLVETIENSNEKAIQIWIWAKALWNIPWVRGAVINFGKGVIAGAGAALGATIVNDTREIIVNGFPKISSHASSDVVGYGRITSGNKVRLAQHLLRQHGYNIAVDGIWGPASANATKQFQTKLKMTPDGLIGKHTWAYLIEHL